MKGRIVDQRVTIYSQPDAMSQPLAELPAGTEIEIEGVKKVAEAQWIQLRGANGQPGYLQPGTRVFVIRQAVLSQPRANAYAQPGAGGQAVRQYDEGAVFTLLDTVTQDGASWVKIRDGLGNELYIEGSTRLGKIDQAARARAAAAADGAALRPGTGVTNAIKEMGKRNMLYGGLWCVGGLVLTCLTMQASPVGLVFWGAIIFGGIQFVRGLMQYSRAG